MCSQNELRKRETGVGIGCYFKEQGQAAPFSDNQEFDFFFSHSKRLSLNNFMQVSGITDVIFYKTQVRYFMNNELEWIENWS